MYVLLDAVAEWLAKPNLHSLLPVVPYENDMTLTHKGVLLFNYQSDMSFGVFNSDVVEMENDIQFHFAANKWDRVNGRIRITGEKITERVQKQKYHLMNSKDLRYHP